MPSIPQSLLWLSLVVLWLFVLVPMLVSKRDAVRRTSDVALATRVLTSGASARLLRRTGPATGHRSDPDWKHSVRDADDSAEDDLDEPAKPMVFVASAEGQTELDYLDVDVVEETPAAEPVAETETEIEAEIEVEVEPPAEASVEVEVDLDAADEAEAAADHEYEYVDDTSGLEAEAEPVAAPSAAPPAARQRRTSATAAAVSARKFEFRKRVLLGLAAVLVGSAASAFTAVPSAWWLCAATAGVTVLYLAYLRRQTRIEQQVRARRMRRTERPRAAREDVRDNAFEVVPSRLRRPGVAVLEIDDEDPVFEHLEYTSAGRGYGWRGDLPRAAGQ
ncbi:hypothetical protein KIH27_13735 [Mycobacterium sp. M1]|uniref:Transmembrane protein n=1 Tax=Mycolicibacter acidiphilus TaxID=2835306 RepID=A0ABS5RK86_9MYCO|nr:gephyrin-like molybdotransferase receptor GlpR [Mycolicibacter acidiphilus]MBS9534650.1 hypothetical protein [Mycolicibacter acidiphilus]